MKRLISLLLAVAMLLSLVPAVLADDAEPVATALEIGTPTPKNETDVDGKSVSYYEIPVSIKNNTDQEVKLTMLECYIKFDASSFKAVSYYKDEDTEVSGITYKRPVNNQTWKNEYSIINGLVTVACGMGPSLSLNDKRITVAAHGSALVFTLNLQKIDDNVESGNYAFTFAEPFEVDGLWKENMIGFKGEVEKDKTDTFYYKQRESNLDCTDTEILPITDGKAPELAFVSVAPGKAEYGSNAELKLTATSTSGKDITSLVTFGVKDPKNAVVTDISIAADGKFTIGNHDAGTYTVWAEPNGTACTFDGGATYPDTTFEIAPKKITNPAAAVVRFVKGNYLMNLQNQTISMDVTTTTPGLKVGFTCYEGTDTSGNPLQNPYQLKAGTLYSIVIGLEADTNYELNATKLKVTVNGGTEQEVDIVASEFEGAYKAIVTAETESAKKPTITNMAAIDAVYGDKLSAHTSKLSGTVTNAAGNPVTGTFTWADDADTTTVGTVGSHEFTVNFTPDDLFNYAPTTAEVTVNVAKKQITFNRNDYKWRAINPDDVTSTDTYGAIHITYDGNEHGLEAYCDNSEIKDYVAIVYKSLVEGDNTDYDANRKATNVCSRTVKAHVIVTDPNCEFNTTSTGIETTLKIDAKVVEGTGEYEKTLPVRYNASSASITIDKFGVPNDTYTYVTSTVEDANGIIAATSAVTVDNQTINVALAEGLTDSAISKEATITLIFTARNHKTSHAAVGTTEAPFVLKLTVQITNKASRTLEVSAPASVVYGTNIEPQLVVSGQPGNAQLTFEYKKTDDNTPVAKIEEADVGNYTVTVSCEDDVARYTGSTTFNITERSIADATVSFGPQVTYDGNPHEQTMTVKVDDTPLTLGMDYELDTENGDSLTQTDAGDYTVVIKGKENSNYMGTLRAKFTIAKATPVASDFTFTPPANLIYDGNPKAASVTTTNTEIGTVTVSYAPAVPTNAGKYTVKISTAETKNYKPVTDLTADDWKFTISQRAVTVTVAPQDKTYDGTTTATITGTLTGVLEKDAANVTLTAPTATFPSKNVGEQTLIVTGEFTLSGSAAGNYVIDPEPVLNSLKATIAKKPLEALADLTADVRYDNLTEQTVTVPAPEGLISGDEQLVTCVIAHLAGDNSRLASVPAYDNGLIKFQLADKQEKTEQLKYSVTLDYGDNYENEVVTNLIINISIRAAQSTLTYTGATSVVYDQSITLTSAGGSGTGAVTYAVVGGDGAATISGNVLTATKAGTVKIQVTKAGDKDYLATTSAVYDITVTKATPATPPEIKVDNTDTTLGELGRDMADKIGVSGTIEWYGPDGKKITDPDNTKIEANKEYSWTFVPDDSDNYSEIKGTTTPYVRDDLSWLPGVINGGSNFTFHDVTRFDYYYDSVKWAADNGIASGTSRFTFSPDAVCTRAQTVTFLWRAAGSPLPRYRACPFTDVHSYDYYYEAVLWAVEQGITTGLTATTFGPDETVTRGQVATFLYRAASAAKPNTFNPFADVKPTAYNYDAILWAYDNRITTGTSTTTFSPDAFCTRAQIVTFLYRYYQGR